MANVLIAFLAHRGRRRTWARPAEQVLAQIAGIEHTYSVARPGLAVVTVEFAVGVPRTEALVRLYDVLNANQNWLPRDLGTLAPVVVPKGIDDVPVVALTLWSPESSSAAELAPVAHAMEAELLRVPGAREVRTIIPGRVVHVSLDPGRLRGAASTSCAWPDPDRSQPGDAISPRRRRRLDCNYRRAPRMLAVETGQYLRDAEDVANLVVGVHQGKPVFLREVARVEAGSEQAQRHVWHTPGAADAAADPAASGVQAGSVHPALTISTPRRRGPTRSKLRRRCARAPNRCATPSYRPACR
jgi:multidrug efflux pump subunit AcrB